MIEDPRRYLRAHESEVAAALDAALRDRDSRRQVRYRRLALSGWAAAAVLIVVVALGASRRERREGDSQPASPAPGAQVLKPSAAMPPLDAFAAAFLRTGEYFPILADLKAYTYAERRSSLQPEDRLEMKRLMGLLPLEEIVNHPRVRSTASATILFAIRFARMEEYRWFAEGVRKEALRDGDAAISNYADLAIDTLDGLIDIDAIRPVRPSAVDR